MTAMKLRHFVHAWRGVQFSELNISLATGAAADRGFYEAFYRALATKKGGQDVTWHAKKRKLGERIASDILAKLDGSRILSVGAGEAISETVWLQRGYAVSLNECQDSSLARVKAEFPDAPIIISDIANLRPEGEFDAISLLTVDYALDDKQLADAFTRLAGALPPSGILINYTANVLTIEQIAKEAIKKMLRRRLPKGSVFWGWYRSPALLRRIAKISGLELTAQYLVKENCFSSRPRWFWPFMPLRNMEIVMTFSKRN